MCGFTFYLSLSGLSFYISLYLQRTPYACLLLIKFFALFKNKNYFHFMYYGYFGCMFVQHILSAEAGRGHGTPGTGVTDGCEPRVSAEHGPWVLW